ncbi:MAG: nucleotide-binding protein, partial [Usitatibacter sp.]
MAGVMIAAGWRSSGKTTVSVGLAAALARRGLAVQPFKRGPDFIDPQWLSAAAGRNCRNLDLRLQGARGLLDYWRQHAAGADIAIVEGSQGLHDGLAEDGSDSNAALAPPRRAAGSSAPRQNGSTGGAPARAPSPRGRRRGGCRPASP